MATVYHSSLGKVAATRISEAAHAVDIYAPYVLPRALQRIASGRHPGSNLSVVTTWKLKDLLLGASSLEVYDFCRANDAYLFLNARLHLKTILRDYGCVLTGSANITHSGLGLIAGSNYETLVEVKDPGLDYLVFLQAIRSEATLVTDVIVERYRTYLEGLSLESLDVIEAQQLALDEEMRLRDAFLISELPMSQSLGDLYRVFSEEDVVHLDRETVANAMHDIAKYSLLGCGSTTKDEFFQHTKLAFFGHPFISALCQFIDRPRRFGEVKEWVQSNCTTVPVPSRRDLTGNVQVLYEWLGLLGRDSFVITQPNVSQIISPM